MDVELVDDQVPLCDHMLVRAGLPCGLPAGHLPPHRPADQPAPAEATPPARKLRSPRRIAERAERDAAYREQLGLDDGDALPKQLGTSGSAGGARGGRGAAQKRTGKRRARFS